MIDTVIFDWGGVISPESNHGWVNVLANKLRISFDEALLLWDQAGYKDFRKGLIGEPEFWDRFEKSYGKPIDSKIKESVWEKGSALNPWPEMLTYARQLKKKGIKVAILSNNVEPAAKLISGRLLLNDFPNVLLSNEIGMAKPEVGIYEFAAKRLGTEPANCIFIDDQMQNIVTAAALGMSTVLAKGEPEELISAINKILNNQ